MRKFKLLIAALMLPLGFTAFAQNITVSGSVVDQSGLPIPGATVMVQGSTRGTSTDGAGAYTLSGVPSRGTLVFSCVGYTEVTVPVNGRTSIPAVALAEDAETLEGTVVVGYGSAKKVTSLVGSVQTVKSDIVKNAPSSSALDQLQGQVAGLSVLSYSGVAGDNAVSMTLHGVGSLGSSSTPLYVIDGIPSTSRSVMAMNPNDIESVSVLKDASATSIYGSRAANGVVYITTKTGAYNERATVSARVQMGTSTLANMTLYENMMSSDELMDFWVRSGIHTQEWVDANYISKGWTANTKWYEYFMNLHAKQSQADVSVQGGGKKVSYMFSASQFSQEGFTIGNYYDRYTMRSNVQAHPVNWLKAGVNLGHSIDKTQQNPNWGSAANGMSNYVSGGLSYLLIPMYPAEINENHRYVGQNRIDPVYYMENNPDYYNRYGVNANVFVEIEPIHNFKIVSRAGEDGYFRLNNWQSNPSYIPNSGKGLAGKSSQFEYSANITNTAEYSFEVGDNSNASVLVGQEGVKNDYRYFYAQSEDQTDDRMLRLQDGQPDTYKMSQSSTESAFLSFFGHADYSLGDKYILDGTVRRDASSRFGRDSKWATFWSAGAKWNIKKAYGSYEELIAAPDVDLVYVGTPHSHHYDVTRKAILAGKPCLVEKAFMANARQAKDIIDLAHERKVFLAEAIWTRYQPAVDIVRRLIADGRIGTPHLITATLGYSMGNKERIMRPDLCGGALLDLGVYALNFVRMFSTPGASETSEDSEAPEAPDILSIDGHCVKSETGMDLTNAITIILKNGLLANVQSSAQCVGDNIGVITGTEGNLIIDNVNNPQTITVNGPDRTYIETVRVPQQITGYEYQFLACREALMEGLLEPREMPHEETLYIMRLMDGLRQKWGGAVSNGWHCTYFLLIAFH